MAVFPYLPVLPAKAGTGDTVTLTSAFGDFGGDHKLYCIDKGGYAFWGIADDGDVYQRHRPSELSLSMTRREQEYIFWGLLTLQASLGIREAADVVAKIRIGAQAAGREPITNLVTEEDLKALIYSAEVRGKYPWLEEAASHTEDYLRMGGLLSGGGNSGGSGSSGSGNGGTGSGNSGSGKLLPSGMTVPSVIADSTSLSSAYQVDRNTLTISFDENGADAEFIRQVPILFSNDNGLNFQPEPTDGWTYQKTDTAIIFYNSNPKPPKALIRFAAEGTEFASAGGYASEKELLEECLQIWECIQCSGNHKGGTPPTSETWHHQRMVWMEFQPANVGYYAVLAGDPAPAAGSGGLEFEVFRHEEDVTSHYNLQLYKYDYETGEPLEGARFALYERFDDAGEIDTERDGAGRLYIGGEDYAGGHTDARPVWEGFRKAASVVTDDDGYAKQTIEHGYHYDKTFCSGHPAPVFTAVPEEETDEETGEVLNEDAIEEAKTMNRKLAGDWLSCEASCGEKAAGDFDGVHFHWILDGVNVGEIETTAENGGSEGETPDGGITAGADGETAFRESGCQEDRDATYERFTALRYSYAWQEFQARDGYIRHDLHGDDLPIEIIATDSSEHGANAEFSGEYSEEVDVEAGAADDAETAAVSTAVHEVPQVQLTAGSSGLQREFIFVDEEGEEEDSYRTSLLEAGLWETATPSDAASPSESGRFPEEASPSEPEIFLGEASPSELLRNWQSGFSLFRSPAVRGGGDMSEELFLPAYEAALVSASVGACVAPGPEDEFSHCSGSDGEGDAWRVYDHRTEGEFHINKKDLDLAAGESEGYDAYGDTQGDSTLEGAVYGLFAAEDIIHPDGKTGVVYQADDLAAVATTDKNGDASFLVYTQGPGRTYSYQDGIVVDRDSGWAEDAPGNLYDAERTVDDYREDGRYERVYTDNEKNNGSCWIGRPLILGDYYVKELSRSEGYELSIGNKMHGLTNRGQETELSSPDDAEGYAVIEQNLYAEEQTSEDGDGAGPNELFFSAKSKDTGEKGYSLVVSGLPQNTAFYRKETGTAVIETEIGTGVWEKVYLTNEDGTPKYIRASNDYQYPKYQDDGTLMTREVTVNSTAESVRQVAVHPLSEDIVTQVLLQAEEGMTEEENKEYLSQTFTLSHLAFVKGKVEEVLRKHKKATPGTRKEDGSYDYSTIYAGVFDSGVREGETDVYGLSGVVPGNPAAETVFGSPVQKLAVDLVGEDGAVRSVADVILQILNYYDSHPYFSFGGIDHAEISGDQLVFTVYASVSGVPEHFMVLGHDSENDSLIFQRIPWIPEDEILSPRYLYVPYSNQPEYGAFGTYEEYREGQIGGVPVAGAVLVPAAKASGDGTLQPKTVTENVYYQMGELVRGADGNYLQAFEYREITKTVTEEVETVRYQPCLSVRRSDGTYVISVDPEYQDSFGRLHTDDGREERVEFKAVLAETEISLTKEEAGTLGPGFLAGFGMNSASYYVHVKKARAKAYLVLDDRGLTGENTYVITASLSYPGQRKIYQDAGTREGPGQVYERIIRQKVKIKKDIQTTPEGAYAHNTNADTGHQDAVTEGFAGTKETAEVLPGFRFKVYLKSNLERLYRNEQGEVIWLTRDGNETEPQQEKHGFFRGEPYADVPKFYTKVSHKAESLTAGSINNNTAEEAVDVNTMLYSFDAEGLISGEPKKGYTRLLETEKKTAKDKGETAENLERYNYEKFFHAVHTANHDKWDRQENASTSFKPLPLLTKVSSEALQNQEASDSVRQFAVRWYLEEEVKKLTEITAQGVRQPEGKSADSQEEIYEKALREAILKAENYLKPFFSYDLDEIYAVAWDAEKNGGADGDAATLTVDAGGEGISKYLPYGVYVAVEQQPEEETAGDFYNRHYRTDQPKEIQIPSLSGEAGYRYESSDTPEKLAGTYQIRMNEEWGETNQADLRSYVIRAHNHDGDFEVYPYGLAPEKRMGKIQYDDGSYSYAGFDFYQGEYAPYKSLYGEEHPACVDAYKSNEAVGRYYHYGSISERSGASGAGKTITGELTGFDGRYFPALVPWTVTEPEQAVEKQYRNIFHTSLLRLEKLDAETGESILHDGAVFTIYSAEREDEKDGNGRVKFYEEDTVITGSREFLEAMGAEQITPAARASLPWEVPYNGKYYGTVSAGTPVCREEEQVVLQDASGNRTGYFRAFSATRDGELGTEQDVDTFEKTEVIGNQNVGYLETPQPLGAGCYVICEVEAPVGYVRNKPMAVELYSDKVTYYLDGDRERRVRAAVYEEETKEQTSRVYVNNSPIRLEVAKTKPKDGKAVFQLNGRLEGSMVELAVRYGLENLELAYNASGTYLGYGWQKGFLESLEQRRKNGEQIELLYENGVFSGMAVLTRKRDTADDRNRYLPGAVLTLYDAIEIKKNGNQEDYRYDGVNVVRDSFGNVSNIYVQKGYAGQKVCYVLDKTDPESDGLEDYKNYTWNDATDDTGSGVWTVKTVEREDTDILFYDLGELSVFREQQGIRYGYDKDGNQIQAKADQPFYALKAGTPYLEILCPDIEELHYNRKERVFDQVPEGTMVYHLDADGSRDSCVDPYTGMAYVTEASTGKIMVWPVKISRDSDGNITAREKIKTSRLAAIHAGTEAEYTIGTWKNGRFERTVNPALDAFGLPEYYQKSEDTYQKGRPIYDRDGDYVRYKYDDKLNAYNDNSWLINDTSDLHNIGGDPEVRSDDLLLHHRQGEGYLIENTWTAGELAPNDPMMTGMTSGQADVLKRVPAGTYILEELQPPTGYAKAMPTGVTVEEQTKVQRTQMTDQPITAVFEKVDAPLKWKHPVLDKDGILTEAEERVEGKAGYSYESIAGAELALYPARRVPAEDLEAHPSGYVLEKTEEEPASWMVLGEDNEKETVAARWRTGAQPRYLEGIPQGLYLLEEVSVPPGYLPASMEVEIRGTGNLQSFTLYEDHSKIEIMKYIRQDGVPVPVSKADGASLALYEALKDENGEVIRDREGNPEYQEDSPIDVWTATDCREYVSEDAFTAQFESLYEEYGPAFAFVSWKAEAGEQSAVRVKTEQTEKEESVRQLWKTKSGQQILIAVSRGQKEDGSYGYLFDYKFNYKELSSEKSPSAVSYDTAQGTHRFDYLNCGTGAVYVLAELEAPAGCRKADPKLLVPEATASVQLYALENEPGYLEILKVTEEEKPLSGAVLALYRADENGEFTDAEAALVEQWTTGSDGRYTEAEAVEGKLPEGLEAGDLRAHRISPLADGIYYLAELEAPEGFIPMQPKKILLTGETPVCIKAENEEKKGRLEIQKLDAEEENRGLSGAVYELTNLDTEKSWKFTTGEGGGAVCGPLDTGFLKDGVWTPYRFSLREIRPPEFHVLDGTVRTFSFADGEGDLMIYRMDLYNEPTRIEIAKTDFVTGHLIAEAELAVYRAKEKDGIYQAVGNPLEQWISDGKSHVICGKLSAGETYLLKELKAPAGYAQKEPVLFAITEDGRQISGISSDSSVISFRLSGYFPDQVESVSVWGRKAIAARYVLTDLASGQTIKVPDCYPVTLTGADGLKEGTLYEEKEETLFSDGDVRTTKRRIFAMALEDGGYAPDWRTPENTVLTIRELEGDAELIASWAVENADGNGYLHTLRNPEYEEKNGIRTAGRNGALGQAVLPGTAVRYELCCVNTGKTKQDMRMSVQLDEQTEWMPANSDALWANNGTLLTASLADMEPGEERRLLLTAAVKPEAEGVICCRAVIGGKEFQESHPVGGSGTVSLINRVTGTAADAVEREFTYRICFLNKESEELKGEVSYRISENSGDGWQLVAGTLRSGQTITLSKNALVTFSGLPWGTLCSVEEARESRQDSELEFDSLSNGTAGAETGRNPVSLQFFYEKRDGSGRELFQKEKRYVLTETTGYSDGTMIQTGMHSFGFDENGAVTWMALPNEKAELYIEKRDWETGELVGDAELQLFLCDRGGTEASDSGTSELFLEQWITKSGEPHQAQAVVQPGDTLLLREHRAPSGYGIAEDVKFKVPETGGILTVQLDDRPIHVIVRKTAVAADGVTELGPLAGAVLRIENAEGAEIYRFVTGSDGMQEIPPILTAGEAYRVVEVQAPSGYEIAEPVTFTAPQHGGELCIVLYDRKKERPDRPGGGSEHSEKPVYTEGIITVHMDDILSGTGEIRLPYRRLSPLPSTGDGEWTGQRNDWKNCGGLAVFGYLGIALFGGCFLFLRHWRKSCLKSGLRKGERKKGDET